MQEFTVKRHHIGDRDYAPGDVRTAAAPDVAHLVRNGVLAPVEAPAKKAAPRAAGKSVRVPRNKSMRVSRNKSAGDAE